MKILIKHFRLITLGLLSLGFSISNAQAGGCSLEKVAGRWSFSEHGTYVPAPGIPGDNTRNLPFSEVGWFELEKDGTGSGDVSGDLSGEVFSSIQGVNLDGKLYSFHVDITPNTCAGSATFKKDSSPRSIKFVLNSKQDEFQFISTSGDLTTIGTAKRDLRAIKDN